MKAAALVLVALPLVALPLVGCTPASEPVSSSGTVVRVVDGDTFLVETEAHPGQTIRVRLLGIDTPELSRDGEPAECGAEAARVRADALTEGRAVLVGDASQPEEDRYGRRLVYLEVAGVDVGLQLVTEGLARTYYPQGQTAPNRTRTYAAAENAARQARTGLWAC